MRRVLLLLAATAVLISSGAAPARAHGDVRLFDGETVIAPGGSARFAGELHYHRLVASVHADGSVAIRFVGRDASGGSRVLVERGPARTHRINELVPCCDRTWTPHTLVVENPGEHAVTIRGTASLVHDDLAVMVYGAEPGTEVAVVLLGVAWGAILWRTVRRRPTSSTAAPRRAPVLRVTGASLALVAVVAALVAIGTLRYGTGGVPAVVAATADVPILPINPVVPRAAVLVGLAILGWGRIATRWATAHSAVPPVPWIATGAALVGAVLVTALAVGRAYGAVAIPVATASVAAVPVAVVVVLLRLVDQRPQVVRSVMDRAR